MGKRWFNGVSMMELLTYFTAIICLLHNVKAKAFQPTQDDVKGTFDHMYENLLLKKTVNNYELRYVPHVDGKQIFIPFGEIPSKVPHFTKVEPPSTSLVPGNLKENKHELPEVVNVFTKAEDLNKDLKEVFTKPIDVNDSASKLKPILKQTENNADEKISFNYEDHDSPAVIESLTEELNYDYPVIIRPETELINKKTVEGQIMKVKPDLYTLEKKVSENKSSKSKYTPIHFDTSNDKEENTGETRPQKYQNLKTKSKDSLSSEILVIGDPNISETSTDFLYSQDYHGEEYNGKRGGHANPDIVNKIVKISKDFDSSVEKATEIDDYDSPVVVAALVRKTNGTNHDYNTPVKKAYDMPVVVEALVQKVDSKSKDDATSIVQTTVIDSPIVTLMKNQREGHNALVSQSKKHLVEHTAKNQIASLDKEQFIGKEISDENHVIIETKKYPLKKKVKYSSKMKLPKSPIHSHYDDSTKLKTKNELIEGSIKKSTNTWNPVSVEQSNIFLNDDLFGEGNDQFDVGSGVINERSLEESRLSKSDIWPVLASFHSQERNKFKKCTTPDKEPGNCMPIQMCPTPNFQLTLDDLMKKICAIDEVFIGICCPEFPAETLKVDWDNFTEVSNNDEIETNREECGKIEDPQSWPWMAPLISVSTRRIFCGGVLINEQYVLTAAHCTRKIPRNQIVVILGASEKSATNQEFEVVEIKRHAQYNPKTMQNDLALLKLSRKVSRQFICLPDEEAFSGVEALLLGWQGSFAASKIDEKLLVLSSEECNKAAVKGNNIMCTQPRTEDVVMCNVDSGAPLIVKHKERYQVVGILTWNRNDCDSSLPAVFTRVSHFRRWIENHSS